MIPIARDARPATSSRNSRAGIGAQPIALTAAALCLILAGAASIALWRAYTGNSPETDRAVAARQLQARAALASEQLAEKTKGLETTQQESIDQLQVMQDQLATVRRLLASQQADTKRLSEQVSGLAEAIDGLRQSYASAQGSEPAPAPATRNRSVRIRAYHRTVRTGQRRPKHS
jgi:septum formation inhibitor MinC